MGYMINIPTGIVDNDTMHEYCMEIHYIDGYVEIYNSYTAPEEAEEYMIYLMNETSEIRCIDVWEDLVWWGEAIRTK